MGRNGRMKGSGEEGAHKRAPKTEVTVFYSTCNSTCMSSVSCTYLKPTYINNLIFQLVT